MPYWDEEEGDDYYGDGVGDYDDETGGEAEGGGAEAEAEGECEDAEVGMQDEGAYQEAEEFPEDWYEQEDGEEDDDVETWRAGPSREFI